MKRHLEPVYWQSSSLPPLPLRAPFSLGYAEGKSGLSANTSYEVTSCSSQGSTCRGENSGIVWMILAIHRHNFVAVMAFLVEDPSVAVAGDISWVELTLICPPDAGGVCFGLVALALEIREQSQTVSEYLSKGYG